MEDKNKCFDAKTAKRIKKNVVGSPHSAFADASDNICLLGRGRLPGGGVAFNKAALSWLGMWARRQDRDREIPEWKPGPVRAMDDMACAAAAAGLTCGSEGAMTSTIFFVISKLVGLVIVGETWLILGLIVALVARWRGYSRLATGLTVTVLAALVTLTAVPVGDWAIDPLEARYPVDPPLAGPPDGILVLGGAVETAKWRATGQVHLNDQAERLTEAAVLALRYNSARVVLSGGGATLGPIGGDVPSEAAAMAALLTELGVDPARLVLEEQSRNTAGNAAFSLDLVRPKPGERWLLVTSASHMPRAMAAFERAGWTGLTAWPVDFSTPPGGRGRTWDLALNLYFLNRAVKEYVGILAYALAARF